VVLKLGLYMNIELDEFVGQDVSDDALEMAAGGARGDVWGGPKPVHLTHSLTYPYFSYC